MLSWLGPKLLSWLKLDWYPPFAENLCYLVSSRIQLDAVKLLTFTFSEALFLNIIHKVQGYVVNPLSVSFL